MQRCLKEKLLRDETRASRALQEVLEVSRPALDATVSCHILGKRGTIHHLDSNRIKLLSALVQRAELALSDLVLLHRGQTADDYRPNKALDPQAYKLLLRGYPHQQLLIQIANEGIQPQWKSKEVNWKSPPKNHFSAFRHENALIRSVREGQDNGQYLVLSRQVI